MKLHAKPVSRLLDGNMQKLRRRITVFAQAGICLALAVLAFGCSTPVLDQARNAYYDNNPQAGLDLLQEASIPDRDEILFCMEKGTLHQLNGDFKESQSEYNQADTLLTQMDTLSISRGAGSMVASDNLLNFYGYPFERTYLHVMDALSYLATGDFQGAGVEARRIIKSQTNEERGEFPEDAFSHYLAGLCLELVDDPANSRVQYRKASKICENLDISDYGMIVREGTIDPEKKKSQPPPPLKDQTYMVCIVLLDRIGDYSQSYPSRTAIPPVVEFSHDGKVLGKAVTMTDLGYLAIKSESLLAVKKAAKTGARIAAKMVVVDDVSEHNGLMGFLLYMLLFSLEQPDYRHWETLPKHINVARFPCPPDLKTLDITVTNRQGTTKRQVAITKPIQHKGLLLVTFERGF